MNPFQEYICILRKYIIRSEIMKQINIALSYMDGNKLRDWVKNYYDQYWNYDSNNGGNHGLNL